VSTGAISKQRRPGLNLIAGILWQQRLGVGLGVASGLLWTSGKIAVPALVRQGIDRGLSGGAPLRWAA
jgi:hypothetical protein